MKLAIIVGARPNYMKVSGFKGVIIHTGQHFSHNMSGDMNIDYQLSLTEKTSIGRIGEMMINLEVILIKEKPDIILTVGDVDSTVAGAMTAQRLGIKTAHIESGLRSYDRTMQEEINRVLTDHISDYLFVTEPIGVKNLKKEGITKNVHLVGDTLVEHLENWTKQNYTPKRDHALITMHRPVNVDTEEGLLRLKKIVEEVSKLYYVVFPVHPRTYNNLKKFRIKIDTIKPLSYDDFQGALMSSHVVITDSGGIQVEASYHDVPCILWRDRTERIQALNDGTVTLCKSLDKLKLLLALILNGKYKHSTIKFKKNVTSKIIKILENGKN